MKIFQGTQTTPDGPMSGVLFIVCMDNLAAILMGVCRGRLSEGLDFKDRKARLGIIVGVPYPCVSDPKIVLKKYYLDYKRD